MRHVAFVAVSLALLLAGCRGPAGNGPVDAQGAEGQTDKAPLPLVEALSGTWMPEAYCACLERHRSAYTCGSLLKEIYVMTVTPKGADSLEWGYITTHEGGPMVKLGYDPASGAFTYRAREDEYLGYQVITIRSIDPDHLEWITDGNKSPVRFRRVESAEAMLNSALFEGRYALEGDTGLVLFRRDGSVEGLPGIDRFMVLTDFTEGLDDRDIVFLYAREYDWSTDAFHYRSEGNELLFFPMDTTAEEYVYQMGELKYRLKQVVD